MDEQPRRSTKRKPAKRPSPAAPAAPAEPPKPWTEDVKPWQAVLFVVGMIVVASFLVRGMSGPDRRSAASTPEPQPQQQETPTRPAAASRPVADSKPDAVRPALGEQFKLGSFSYVIKSVDVAETAGSGFAAKHASEGARYVLVHYTIQNDGNETATVLTDDFRIVDAQKRQFRPSSEANTAIVMSGGKDLVLSQVQPGLKKTMVTAFELPEAVANGVFDLVIPEKGLLGHKRAVITLK